MNVPRRFLAVLALLLVVLGVGLRFYHPERMVVWHDEVFSLVRVFGYGHDALHQALFTGRLLTSADLLAFQHADPAHSFRDTLVALAQHPEHGPLYYLLAWVGTQVVDAPLLALRGTSALLSLLLLPAIFWLARELFGAGRTPWIALSLAAMSPVHLLYAQEARQYGLWTALAAAASAAFLRALRWGRSGDWILYGVLVALGLYTHLLFAVVLGIHALHGLLTLRGDAPRAAGHRWLMAVTGAAVVFLPWVAVLLWHWKALNNFTRWMAIKATFPKLAAAWAGHVVHPFADLPAPWVWLLLLPLAAAVYRFVRAAPRESRFFVGLLILLPAAVVAGPDLLMGGSRSLQARYLFPLFLGLELMVAWVLAEGLAAGRHWAGMALAGVLVLGLVSDLSIARSETWWNKSFSAGNAALARLVNAAPRPLVVGSDGPVNVGELLSLAWRLKPEARFLLEPPSGGLTIPGGFSDLFILLPSEALRRQLEADYRLEPFQGSWQWFLARPKPGG